MTVYYTEYIAYQIYSNTVVFTSVSVLLLFDFGCKSMYFCSMTYVFFLYAFQTTGEKSIQQLYHIIRGLSVSLRSNSYRDDNIYEPNMLVIFVHLLPIERR
jgi:hypothetical protein